MPFKKLKSIQLFFATSLLLLSVACEGIFKGKDDEVAIARVGDTFLYEDDVVAMIPDNMSAQDSAFFVANYINTWATKQLLLSKARINLSEEEQRQYNRLVEDYRSDLYTRAYMDALVKTSNDTSVSNAQLRQFYNDDQDMFKISEKLLRLRFVEVSPQFLNKDDVKERIRRFNTNDKNYLDSITVQFKKIHFDDSVWVSASRLMEEIRPLDYQNIDRHLKKSQFFELSDSLGIYLGRITDLLDEGEIAPLSYITPKMKQIILNRRRLDYVKNLEKDILDEAIKSNEFEIYTEEE